MTGNKTTGTPSRKSHNVATSSVLRPGVAFAGSVSAEERTWLEAHSIGCEFIWAANKLVPNRTGYGGAPVYVLYAHAIEMVLKSFLLRMGKSKTQLKKISHDLNKLLTEAKGLGLSVSDPDTDNIVSRINEALKNAALRYEFPHSMPLVGDVEDVAKALLKDTQPPLPTFPSHDSQHQAPPQNIGPVAANQLLTSIAGELDARRNDGESRDACAIQFQNITVRGASEQTDVGDDQ